MFSNDPQVDASFFECLINQSPYPMWISDDNGILIRINPACKKMLDLTDEDVVGIYNILEDNIVAEQGFLPLVKRVYEAGETARFEIRYDSSQLRGLTLSGHAFVILDVTIFPIKNAAGTVTNAVIQHVDITNRRLAEEALQQAYAELEERIRERTADLTAANKALKREMAERREAEDELRKSEKLFRTLCETAPIGIYKVDHDSNMVFGNRRLREIAGMSGDAPIREGWLSAIHSEDLSRVTEVWSAATAAGRPYLCEYRLLRPDGGEVLVRSLAMPLTAADGAVTGYVGTVEDITELSRAREEMLRTQKLESLGVLAGGIAHDFNNLLMIILGYTSLARSRANDPEIVTKRLDDAEKAVMRARELTQQLVTFARGGDPVKRVIAPNDLLEEAATFASLGSNARCTFALANDLSPVEADEGQLSQVIHNLVINAVQAMPEGGMIWIASENAISPDSGQKLVKITIRDEGIGIAPQHRTKIFDPYFTTKQQGSGLGLASCYSIIRKHGGTITVDSVLGVGSTFSIYLPAVQPVSVEHHPAAADETAGAGRILVLDDDVSIREVALSMLEELGYEAEGVADGRDAVDLYRRRLEDGTPFAAVIMDLTVPGGVGGKDAVAAIRLLDPEVKAIVSSGYSIDPVLANSGEYGFRAVLAKPYSFEEMARVLREVLRGETGPRNGRS